MIAISSGCVVNDPRFHDEAWGQFVTRAERIASFLSLVRGTLPGARHFNGSPFFEESDPWHFSRGFPA